MAQRETQALAKSEADGLQYRTCDNNRFQGPTVHEAEAFYEEPSAFSELQAEVLATVLAAEANRTEAETIERLRPLQREIAELKGRLDAALQIIGAKISRESDAQKRDDDGVVDLPDWRKRHVG
jgi:DNA-directed RNA polymerase specialized sigma24 family protein